VSVFAVEVHELDPDDTEARLLDDVRLNRRIGKVLRLHARRGFDLGQNPGVPFSRERVDGDENAVFEEARFEDGGRTGGDGFAGRRRDEAQRRRAGEPSTRAAGGIEGPL
jgi:hypothetical protein